MIITGTARIRFVDDQIGLMFEGLARIEKDAETGVMTVTPLESPDEEPNPPCAWCPEPAGEQILMSADDNGRRQYAWLCDPCADAAKTKKETSS